MPKDQLEVIAADQADRIERIKTFHALGRKAAEEPMAYAFLCGVELNAAKDAIPHGQFTEWRDRYLPEISQQTTSNYMRFADALKPKLPTVGNLNRLQLTNGELPEKEKAEILKAVHDLADGKTLTQLYRDLGVIRQPRPPGGFRPDAKAVQAWLKEHHPDLVGTKYDDLPVAIQKEFKQQYKPELDPKLLAAARLDKATGLIDDLEHMLHDQEFKKFWDDALRARAIPLFHDFHKALCALQSKAPRKPRRKKGTP